MHTLNDKDMTWFNPMWACDPDGHFGFWSNSDGDEAFELMIGATYLKSGEGVWCDIDITYLRPFICEALM